MLKCLFGIGFGVEIPSYLGNKGKQEERLFKVSKAFSRVNL